MSLPLLQTIFSFCAHLNKRDQDLYDWQKIIERAVNVEAKASCQTPFLARKTDTCYPYKHKPTRSDKYKDKDFKTKNTHSPSSINQGNNRNESQLGQALGQAKKDSRPNYNDQWDHTSNTLTTSSNAMAIKKDKKQGDKDLN